MISMQPNLKPLEHSNARKRLRRNVSKMAIVGYLNVGISVERVLSDI